MTEGIGSERLESPPRGYQPGGGLVPVPDPTLLTTQNLLREVASLKELMESRINASQELVDQKIATSDAVANEKFIGVAAQFSERDTRTDQRAGDTKLAVDVAFAAATEATAKIETGFTKQIDAMTEIINTKTRNIEGNISDLKERLIALEARGGTTVEVRRDSREDSRNTMSAISIAVALVALAAVVIMGLVKH